MSIANKELQAWINVIVLIMVCLIYLFNLTRADTLGSAFTLAFQSSLLIVFGLVVLLGLVSLFRRPEREDERDRLIVTRAYRNAYFVAASGLFIALVQLLGVDLARPFFEVSTPQVATIHILMLSLLTAELTNSVSRVVYYRRNG